MPSRCPFHLGAMPPAAPPDARLTAAAGSDNPAGRNQKGCEQPMQPIRIRLILAALGLALAAPLAAQEAPPPPAAGGAAPPRPRAGPRGRGAGGPGGRGAGGAGRRRRPPAGAAPAAAPRRAGGARPQPEVMEIVRDTFGDWQVRCAPEGNECFMYQLALDAAEEPGRRGQHPEAARGRPRPTPASPSSPRSARS